MENYKIILLTDSNTTSAKIETYLTDFGLNYTLLKRKEDLLPTLISERINLLICKLENSNSFDLIQILNNSNTFLTKKLSVLCITDSAELYKNSTISTIANTLDPIDFENMVFDLLDASEAAYAADSYTYDPTKHYNLTYLYEHAHGDEKFVHELLTMFVRDMPTMLQLLEKEYNLGEMNTLTNTAHKLKSQMALLGLDLCKTHLNTIEQNAKNGLAEIPTLISEINTHCLQAITELKADFNL